MNVSIAEDYEPSWSSAIELYLQASIGLMGPLRSPHGVSFLQRVSLPVTLGMFLPHFSIQSLSFLSSP